MQNSATWQSGTEETSDLLKVTKARASSQLACSIWFTPHHSSACSTITTDGSGTASGLRGPSIDVNTLLITKTSSEKLSPFWATLYGSNLKVTSTSRRLFNCTTTWCTSGHLLCISNAIGIIAEDRNNERERKGERSRTQSSAHAISSILHLHVVADLSESMFTLWTWYQPVSQTELESWLMGPYPGPLAKGSKKQGSKTIGGSCSPLVTGDWLLSSYALRMRLGCAVNPFASGAGNQFRITVRPLPLNWALKTSQPGGRRRAFPFVLVF